MDGPGSHVHRFRVVLELGPSYDYSRLALLRWLIRWLIDMRMDCPVPFSLRVEPLVDDDPP
jgi:hypothetical protein